MQRFALPSEEAAGYAALVVAMICDALAALGVTRAAFHGAGALFYMCTSHRCPSHLLTAAVRLRAQRRTVLHSAG